MEDPDLSCNYGVPCACRNIDHKREPGFGGNEEIVAQDRVLCRVCYNRTRAISEVVCYSTWNIQPSIQYEFEGPLLLTRGLRLEAFRIMNQFGPHS